MASSYPGGLDSFATNKANATATVTDHPAHHNDLADAINKIEAELGTNPSGAAASVAAAIAAVSAPFAAIPNTPVSVASVTDVTLFTHDLTGVAAGDIIEVDIWGILQNGTGANRTTTFTLDFDARFDIEHAENSVSSVGQVFRITARLSVHATNEASVDWESYYNDQTSLGVVRPTPAVATVWDSVTDDLTGTVTVALLARSDTTGAPHTATVKGVIIRKTSS